MADCLFCQIARKEIPARIVYEDENLVCFHDIKPSAPVDVLIIPKKHLLWQDLLPRDSEELSRIFIVAPKIAEKLGILQDGYKLVMNCGKAAGQLVPHFHLHLLGGWVDRPKLHNLA